MTIHKRVSVITGMALLLAASGVFAGDSRPSWCKATQLSSVEKMICDDNVLGASDDLMSQLYTEVMSFRGKEGYEGMWPGEVKSNQVDWIAKRNKAKDKMSVLDLYMSQINTLHAKLRDLLQQ